MAKSLCHLLMKVNHVIVAYMSLNAIRKNIILAKISELIVHKGLGTAVGIYCFIYVPLRNYGLEIGSILELF